MGKLKEDFAAGTKIQKIKFCANLIEQYSFEGKSKNKIGEELRKLGADYEIILASYDELSGVELPTEKEKAWMIINKNFDLEDKKIDSDYSEENEILYLKDKQKQFRKILNKLAYLHFDEDVLAEISEELIDKFNSQFCI